MTGPGGRAAIPVPRRPRAVIIITALRASLAFGIGAALLLTPDRGEEAVASFMALYWLVSGVFSLAWARRGPFLRRLSLVAGIFGVVAGGLFLLYPRVSREVLPAEVLLGALGIVIAMTGVLHLAGGYLVGERIDRWPAGHLLLGCLELVLAGVLLLAPARIDLLDVAAAVWALSAGTVLAFDAVRAQRRWSAGDDAPPAASGSADSDA